MSMFDLTEFFKLSAVLNYNLSAASLNRYNVLKYILAGKQLDPDETRDRERKGLIMEVLGYLFSAYSHKRRRLGPMAVLHPLRAAALMARAADEVDLDSILTVLFHDILEDVKSIDFEAQEWKEMEQRLYHLLEHMEPEEESQLIQRLKCLTRTPAESYYRYIARMLEGSSCFPRRGGGKTRRSAGQHPGHARRPRGSTGGDRLLPEHLPTALRQQLPGYVPRSEHLPSTVMNGARRLYQLFKNAVLLSLIRQLAPASDRRSRKILFDAISEASLREAQRTLMHLVGYHLKDHRAQRDLILDAMDYCYSGRSDLVTKPGGSRLLDGLFSTYFAPTQKKALNQQLDSLYQNKPLMIQTSIAFIVIFLGFLNDSHYYIRGISAEGIKAR